jgi:hypothetical protein
LWKVRDELEALVKKCNKEMQQLITNVELLESGISKSNTENKK